MSVPESQSDDYVTRLAAERETLLSEFHSVVTPAPGDIQVLVFGRRPKSDIVSQVHRHVLRLLRTQIVALDMELRRLGVDPGPVPLLPDAG